MAMVPADGSSQSFGGLTAQISWFGLRVIIINRSSFIKLRRTSSSAIAERLRCRVGQFWTKVEDDIVQTL